jgi:hypothetical protein
MPVQVEEEVRTEIPEPVKFWGSSLVLVVLGQLMVQGGVIDRLPILVATITIAVVMSRLPRP